MLAARFMLAAPGLSGCPPPPLPLHREPRLAVARVCVYVPMFSDAIAPRWDVPRNRHIARIPQRGFAKTVPKYTRACVIVMHVGRHVRACDSVFRLSSVHSMARGKRKRSARALTNPPRNVIQTDGWARTFRCLLALLAVPSWRLTIYKHWRAH